VGVRPGVPAIGRTPGEVIFIKMGYWGGGVSKTRRARAKIMRWRIRQGQSGGRYRMAPAFSLRRVRRKIRLAWRNRATSRRIGGPDGRAFSHKNCRLTGICGAARRKILSKATLRARYSRVEASFFLVVRSLVRASGASMPLAAISISSATRRSPGCGT